MVDQAEDHHHNLVNSPGDLHISLEVKNKNKNTNNLTDDDGPFYYVSHFDGNSDLTEVNVEDGKRHDEAHGGEGRMEMDGKMETGIGGKERKGGLLEKVTSRRNWKESCFQTRIDKLTVMKNWLPEDHLPDAHPAMVLPSRSIGNARPISNAN